MAPLYAPFVDTYARYTYAGADRGYLAENYPFHIGINNTVLPTAGLLQLSKIRLPVGASVTNVILSVITAGGTLTAGQCFAALYTGAGVRVGVTADQAVAWASAGVKAMALASGPFACAAGDYYVAAWFNGTTGPALMRSSGQGSGFINNGFATPNFLWATADTGLTTTAPANLATPQTGTGSAYWCALS